MSVQKRLYRSRTDRQIAGVAGGLAEYLGIDPTLVRLGFIFLTLAGGHGVLLYIILWLVMPEAPEEDEDWEEDDLAATPNITLMDNRRDEDF